MAKLTMKKLHRAIRKVRRLAKDNRDDVQEVWQRLIGVEGAMNGTLGAIPARVARIEEWSHGIEGPEKLGEVVDRVTALERRIIALEEASEPKTIDAFCVHGETGDCKQCAANYAAAKAHAEDDARARNHRALDIARQSTAILRPGCERVDDAMEDVCAQLDRAKKTVTHDAR